MEEATFLAKFASEVVLIHRRDEFRASRIMVDAARSTSNLEILTPYTIEDVLGVEDGKVSGVRLRHAITGEERIEEASGFFVAIGHDPNTGIFLDWLEHDASGYLVCEPGSTRTKVDGVFAAGDVQDHVYRQAVTAAGSGCMAALDAEKFLEEHTD
jgi:thioredoxin reductase (NADPH)